MDDNGYKIVDFEFCNTCKHRDVPQADDPCHECLGEPVNLYSHRPVNYEKDENYIKKEFGYYDSIRKVKDYLFEVGYGHLNYGKAFDYFKKQEDGIQPGSCSAVKTDIYFGRNFDWYYSNQAEFVVRTKKTGQRYASIGIAGSFSKLTNEYVSSGKKDELYFVLPFQLQDGINEHGVAMSINVVPADYGFNKTVPDIKNDWDISALMLIRFVLDRFSNATDAVNYIRNFVSVYFPKYLHENNYEVHYLISDKEHSYVIEFVDNKTVIINVDERPYITNFHLYNTFINEDGTVYTPETQHDEYNALDFNRITPNGSGLERYNSIADWCSLIHILLKDSVRDLLDDLTYTKAYLSSPEPSNPYWYTEFTGVNDLTVASPVENFSDTISAAADNYTNRSREDGKTWHTMHSSIYNMNTKKLYLVTQEDGNEIEFTL